MALSDQVVERVLLEMITVGTKVVPHDIVRFLLELAGGFLLFYRLKELMKVTFPLFCRSKYAVPGIARRGWFLLFCQSIFL